MAPLRVDIRDPIQWGAAMRAEIAERWNRRKHGWPTDRTGMQSTAQAVLLNACAVGTYCLCGGYLLPVRWYL